MIIKTEKKENNTKCHKHILDENGLSKIVIIQKLNNIFHLLSYHSQ